MTERFKIKLSDIGELMDCDTQSILAISSIANELIPLCDLLNALHEENQQLKTLNCANKEAVRLNNIKCVRIAKENEQLEKENEKLKQFEQLVFNLIDKSLEKDKRNYEMTYEDYLNGRIEALEELKKELM